MTTDNGAAAAVADPEVSTPAVPEAAPSSTEQPAAPEAAAAAEGAASESPSAAADEEEITLDGFLAAKKGKTAAAAEPDRPQLPGVTQADIDRQADLAIQQWTNGLLQNADPNIRKAVEDAYEKLGDRPSAQQVLEFVRPWIANATRLTNDSIFQRVAASVGQVLTEEEYAPLIADGRKFAGYHDIIKAVRETVRHQAEQDWKKQEGKTWVSKKEAEEYADAKATRERARIERQMREGTYQSGQDATGGAARTKGPLTLEEALSLPISELEKRK